ncbi:alpha-amylase family protein [Paenibacillus daejeonensis]|uniref:alpha-amylase family protein n=1 Tax=Paenibacillus daejeonensis TaxID=135193 RepID=UPI000371F778|nr:alpha-amylase family protein [Paenibacillus daejeonensis]
MTWWTGHRLRMIQNNLREIDADLDVDLLMRELKKYEANTLMMNAGGMFAFYPTKLPFQYKTPYLKKDLLGEAVEKAHQQGMRFIGRFDFSKAHESLFQSNPEWFYRTRDGREVNYHGIVHTCLNSEYQQQLSLQMIDEVISNYEVDGIFFNMFGYQHWDYSGNFYGPCYCENCKRRFQEYSGEDLTTYDGANHPLHGTYRKFQEFTAREVLERIHDMVKAKRPDVAICTYHPHKVDLVRKESNTALSRPYPLWLYSASENVVSVEGSYSDKWASNCSINAIDLNYRFTGVSRHENEVRLYENLANGSNLDFCIIGVFEGYPDRANFASAQEVFRFHHQHQDVFDRLRPVYDVTLIKPDHGPARDEYLGIFKMLKERHIPFTVVTQERIIPQLEQLRQAKAVILPGVHKLEGDQVDALDSLWEAGIHLIGTGLALTEDTAALKRLFGAECSAIEQDVTASYFDTSDAERFRNLEGRGWIIGSDKFAVLHYEDEATEQLLPYIESATFGPPERAYGHQSSGRYGLALIRGGSGHGSAASYAFAPGALYYRHGYEDHKYAVTDVLEQLLQGQLTLQTDAPSVVETFVHRIEGTTGESDLLLQLVNLSGFNGTTYTEALPLQPVRYILQGIPPQARAYSLKTGQEVHLAHTAAGTVVEIGCEGRYEAIRIERGDVTPSEEPKQ